MFDGSCLSQDTLAFTYKEVFNIYIVYEITDLALRNSLFRAVKLTRNVDFDKYKHSGYPTGFDVRGSFSLLTGRGFSRNVIMLGVD